MGTYGNNRGDDRGATDACAEINKMLSDDDLRAKARKITYTFNEDTIAQQSARCVSHPGWMMISDHHVQGQADTLCAFVLPKVNFGCAAGVPSSF